MIFTGKEKVHQGKSQKGCKVRVRLEGQKRWRENGNRRRKRGERVR